MKRLMALMVVLVLLETECVAGAEPLRLGVLANRSKPLEMLHWQPLATYLQSTLAQPVELTMYHLPELDTAATRRAVDIVITNPSHLILLQQTNGISPPLATLISMENGRALNGFGGVIFTRADRGDVDSLADLAGKRITAVSLEAFGAYQVQAFELVEAGVPLPSADRLLLVGQPQDLVVEAVLGGRADVGFVRAGILEWLVREGKLDMSQVKVINRQSLPAFPFALSTRLYPEWPVAVMPQVDRRLAAHMAAALFSLPYGSFTGPAAQIYGFTPPANYDGVDNLLRRLRLPPFDTIPEVTPADLWHRYASWIVTVSALLLLLLGASAGLIVMYRRSRKGEVRFKTVADYNYDWEYWRGPNLEFLYISPSCERVTGYSQTEFISDAGLIERIVHPDDRQLVDNHLQDMQDDLEHSLDFRIIGKDGEIRWIAHGCRPIYGRNGEFLGRRVSNRDITERKQAEVALHRLNRELRAISSCNQALMRAEDEQTLLDNICEIICSEAGYRMAWVGYAEYDDAKTVRPVAWGGVEHGYLATANITWADTERGHGPSGMAIRSGVSNCIQDFATEPKAAPWREGALQRGFRSSIALPLKKGSSETFGVLNIYAAEPNAFTPDEVRLLEELATDLAFGITVLRARIDLKHAEEKIQTLNQKLEQRVISRTAQLEAANKELEEFSYSISHDMRTPLRAIDGFSTILLDEHSERLNDEGRELQAAVRRNGQHLGRLIDGMLDFLNMRNRKLFARAIDMADLVQEVFAELERSSPTGRLRLVVGSLPPAWADYQMIREVVRNLLSNAVKFSSAERELIVEVGGTAGTSENTYYFKDNGVGFDMRYADKLFKVFERVHPTGQYEGSAIGLAVVKRIVERHGGRVWAEGTVDEGAIFSFSLPNRESEGMSVTLSSRNEE